MNATERLYRIDNLLRARGCVPLQDFLDDLGVSRATFKRDLELMRDRMNAPIVWDRERGGYRFAEEPGAGPRYELPGLWFSPQEAEALLTMHRLLEGLQPSLLGAHVKPLLARITALLSTGDKSAEEVRRRIKVIHFAARRLDPRNFEVCAAAVLQRRRLALGYYNRARDELTRRTVSPQRLVFYRNNWYLDAWCHLRRGLRSFSLDAVRDAALLAERARDVPDARLDAVLKDGYGIFSGRAVAWAKLRFSPTVARWVSLEEWHERQRARFEPDGSWVLEIPYSSDRELSMDIMKYGADCEVLAPRALRESIRARHAAAARALA